jgi:bacterioferritin (cytochrome b1)
MTAVNQQFIHVLALRDWGYAETAERIMEVDRADFPNAMQIIDYLVETEAPILLASDPPTPGTNHRSILVSEQAMEQRLFAAIEKAACTDDRARALISTAKAPREGYAVWLTDQLKGPGGDRSPEDLSLPETGRVFAHLIATIEQAMVHAFVHWHRSSADIADATWATSGAAMMAATEFVHLFAARQTVPLPGAMPALRIASEPAAALDFDRQLAGRCAREAAEASDTCNEIAIAELCRRIADYSAQLSSWMPGQKHPASNNNPAAFSSFEATLRRYVWAQGSTG